MDRNCTVDEWINREIISTDFKKLAEDSRKLYLDLEKYGEDK